MTHTRGPWTVSEDGTTYKRATVISDDPGWGLVAAIRGPKSNPEVHANARLIAAAPELLEAAKRVIEWCETGCDPSTQSLSKMRAAIALAEER